MSRASRIEARALLEHQLQDAGMDHFEYLVSCCHLPMDEAVSAVERAIARAEGGPYADHFIKTVSELNGKSV